MDAPRKKPFWKEWTSFAARKLKQSKLAEIKLTYLCEEKGTN